MRTMDVTHEDRRDARARRASRREVLDRLLLAGVDVVRLNLCHGHARRAHRPAARGSCRRRRAPAWSSACSPTCPGRRCAPASCPPTVSMLGRRVDRRRWCPATVDSDSARVIRVDYPTLLARPARRRPRRHRRRRHLAAGRAGHDRRASTAGCVTGGTTQGRPGVHIPSERLRLRTPTADDLAPRPRRWRPRVSTSSRCRSSAPPPTRRRCATPSLPLSTRTWSPRSRRCRRSTTRGDRRRGRRDHGGSR